MGVVGAFVSGGARELLIFDLSLLSEFQLLLTQNAMITVFAFSFIVGVGVALPPSIHALLITPTEAHSVLERDVLVGTETMGSAGTDLIGFGISMFLLSPMLMSLRFMTPSYSGLAAVAIVLIPILVVFILTLARLMSRPTSRMKAKFMDMIGRGRLGPSSRVLSRNIRLFKKSEAMGSIFIAMVFTAGVFSAISATTGNAHMRDVFMFQTGADIRVDVDPLLNNVTLDLIDNITRIDGVESASGVLKFEGQITYTTSEFGLNFQYNETTDIYGVQPQEWIDSAFWLDYFTLDEVPASSIARLAENPNNILASFRPVLYYDISPFGEFLPVFGNEVSLEIQGAFWKNYTDSTIVDVLASDQYLYAASTKFLPGQPAAQNFVVVNLDFLHDCLNVSEVNSFYVNLEENANHTQVALDIYDVAPHSFQEIDIAKTYIDASLESRAGQSIYGAYTLNVIFSIIYLSAGVMIVTMVRFSKLQRQFSVMRALGAETRFISLSVLGSALAGLLIASIIGILIGLILTSFTIQLPLAYMGAQTASLWNRLPVVLVVPYLLIGGILGTAVIFTLGITYAVASRGLGRNIAQEIQYTD
jgi:ABC-type antimicrobial peptide transport system permease subunit